MGSTRALFQQVSALVSAKLGRCSRCMQLSFNGALIGWGVLIGVVHFWPESRFNYVLLLWPASFTILGALHVLTYASRIVVWARGAEHSATDTEPIVGPVGYLSLYASRR